MLFGSVLSACLDLQCHIFLWPIQVELADRASGRGSLSYQECCYMTRETVLCRPLDSGRSGHHWHCARVDRRPPGGFQARQHPAAAAGRLPLQGPLPRPRPCVRAIKHKRERERERGKRALHRTRHVPPGAKSSAPARETPWPGPGPWPCMYISKIAMSLSDHMSKRMAVRASRSRLRGPGAGKARIAPVQPPRACACWGAPDLAQRTGHHMSPLLLGACQLARPTDKLRWHAQAGMFGRPGSTGLQ